MMVRRHSGIDFGRSFRARSAEERIRPLDRLTRKLENGRRPPEATTQQTSRAGSKRAVAGQLCTRIGRPLAAETQMHLSMLIRLTIAVRVYARR
jgi:hypothetical protein